MSQVHPTAYDPDEDMPNDPHPTHDVASSSVEEPPQFETKPTSKADDVVPSPPEKKTGTSAAVKFAGGVVFILVVLGVTLAVLAGTNNLGGAGNSGGGNSLAASNGAGGVNATDNSTLGGTPAPGSSPGTPPGTTPAPDAKKINATQDGVLRPLPFVPKGKLAFAWNGTRVLARGYDGGQWEAMPNSKYVPATVECTGLTCYLRGMEFVIENITVPAEIAAASANQHASHLLSQGGFGGNLQEVKRVASTYGNDNVSGWVLDQMALKATLTRVYYRQRVNSRLMPGAYFNLPETEPCMLDTRWHEYTFETRDIGRSVVVSADTTNNVFVLNMDGIIRTTTTHFAGQDYPGSRSLPATYVINSVRDGINSTVVLKGLNEDLLNPVIKFTATAAAALGSSLQVLAEDQAAWSDVVGGRTGSRILTWRGPACTVVANAKGDAFIRYGASLYLRFDKRIRLWTNTLEQPSYSGGGPSPGTCPITTKSIENRDHCVRRTACGVNTTVHRGAEVTLNDATLKAWNTDTASPRLVYFMLGLRLESEYAVSFCSSVFSRWLKVASCTATSFKSAATLSAIQDALTSSTDTNTLIRDISITSTGCDSSDSATIGAFVIAGGSCWQHVHPDLYSVHDATQWAKDHDGNSAAMAGGGANPISKFASLGSASLTFPVSHAMQRWSNRKSNLPYVGRYGDKVNFVALDPSLQTAGMATFVNATIAVVGDEAITCGSPNEVTNVPSLGHHYKWEQGVSEPITTEFNFNEVGQHQRVMSNVAMKADDQLRQRTAWALSNLFVIGGDKFFADALTKWYDIFVQNAFGNFLDILGRVTWNSRMAEWLTFHNSQSTEARNGAGLPDENYAREIMQLFTIGLWKLNDDGTQVLDDNGEAIKTYSPDDIMDFARVFTGIYMSLPRMNVLDQWFMDKFHFADPPTLRLYHHDMLPKGKLDGGHLGDYYPLCDDLGTRPWLQKGARFEFTGRTSFEGPDLDDAPATAPINQRTRFTPAQDGTSALYGALCAAPSAGARCSYPMVVTLDSTLACAGDQECNANRVAVVAVYDPVGKVTMYYRFIEPPCVRLTFFENGMQQQGKLKSLSACSARDTLHGHPSCCASADLTAPQPITCRFANEMMSYTQAEAVCKAAGMTTCQKGDPSFANTCGNATHLWTSNACSLQIQVYDEQRISIYDPTFGRRQFSYNSYSFFRARWNDAKAPAPDASGACPADSPCHTIATGDRFSCICNVSVKETTPFAAIASLENATVESIAATLFVGAAQPVFYGTYTQCTSATCTALASRNVKVWLNTGDTEAALTQRTIIEIPGARLGSAARLVFNRLSTVHVGAYSFRNMPNFMPNTGFTAPDRGSTHAEDTFWWDRKMEQEVNALHEHLFEHQNTPAFVAKHMIKHMITSNPSPRFVLAAADAFRKGVSGGVTFSQKYGDMGAMIHAILTDQEARTLTLLADTRSGMVLDPVVKVISTLRGLEYASRNGRELSVELDNTGMNFLGASTVFGAFNPFYQPIGSLSENGLFAPQAELVTSPNTVSLLNGLHSLIDHGLSTCEDGLGKNLEEIKGCRSNSAVNRAEADGIVNMKPSATDAVAVLQELSLVLTGGRLTQSSHTWSTLTKEYETVLAAGDADAALRHVTKLVLSSAEFHTSVTHQMTSTVRPPPPPPKSKGRRMKSIIFINLQGGADTASFLVPYDGCTDEHGKAFDLYQHYKDVRTLSTHDKANLHPIDANSNQRCTRFSMHESMAGMTDLYKSGELLWFANIGGLVEPLTNVTYNWVTKKKPRFLFSHNFMQDAMQKADSLQTDPCGIVGRATDALSGRAVDPYEVWLTDLIGSSTALKAKLNRHFTLRGDVNLLRQRANLQPILENMTANVSESMMASHFLGEMVESIKAATTLDGMLKAVPEPPTWGNGQRFASDCHRAAHSIRAAAAAGKERSGMYTVNSGWDSHGTADLKSGMKEISDGLAGLVQQLKSDGVWNDTVIVVTSEFGRTGTNNGAGTDHGWGGNNFILGGAVKGGRILGEYPHQLEHGPWVVGRRSVWLPSTPWEGMWKGILEWYGLTDDEITQVIPHVKNFPADRIFDQAEIFH